MRVPKFVVYFCRSIRYACIAMDSSLLRCTKKHRLKIIYLLHPISFAMMLLFVGLFLYYEMFHILPELYDTTGYFYKLHWVLALFVVHNVVGNLLYCYLTDTSFLSLPRDRQDPIATEAHLWHLCTHCQMLVPPRAWHCRLCNKCMLKRDHHCNVAANCIGYRNQRFFFGLLFHLTLGTLASVAYNMIHMIIVRIPLSGDPLLLMAAAIDGFDTRRFMSTMEVDTTKLIVNGIVLKLSLFAMFLAGGQLIFHFTLIIRGSSMFHMWDNTYNLGVWNNLRSVLGDRMFWTLLSPMIDSALPHDGTRWQLAPPKQLLKEKPSIKDTMCDA